MNCVLASFGIEPYPLNSIWVFFFFFDRKTSSFIKIMKRKIHHGKELALKSKDSLPSKSYNHQGLTHILLTNGLAYFLVVSLGYWMHVIYIPCVLLGMTINCLVLNILDYSKTYFNWWNELPVDFMG